MTVHHVSSHLDIEEHWTEERTPQLREVKVIAKHGMGDIVAEILP